MAKSLFSKADPYHAANGEFDFSPGGPQQKKSGQRGRPRKLNPTQTAINQRFNAADPWKGKPRAQLPGQNLGLPNVNEGGQAQRRGRPSSVGGRVTELQQAQEHGLSGRDRANLVGSLGGDLAADMATRFGMRALTQGGMEIGSLFGPEGTVLGGVAGYAAGKAINWGAPVLAGIVGSYLGGKTANALYDLRQRIAGTQLAEAQSSYGGALTPRQVAGEAGAQVVGSAGYLAGEKALGSEKIGGKIGQAIGAMLGHPGIGEVAGETLGASAAAWPADYAGYRLGQQAYDASGAQDKGQFASKDVNVARRAIKGAIKSGVAKAARPKRFPLLDTHSKFDGSFESLKTTAPPFLFGEKQWKEVKGTLFGNYLQQKLDEAAEAMDEAEQQEPMPPEPGMFGGPSPSFDQAHSMFHGASAAAQGQPPSPDQPSSPDSENGDSGENAMQDMGKSFGFRLQDDMNSRLVNSGETGGVGANVRFLRRLMEMDAKSRRDQLRRSMKGQSQMFQNLQPGVGEDEKTYRARVNSLFRQGVDGVPARLYKVRLRAPQEREREGALTLEYTIDKALTTESSLKKGLVYGWFSVIEKDGKPVVDHDKDWTDEEELVKAAHDYITHRTGGVLHDEKGNEISHTVESLVFTRDVQKALGIDLGKVGWFGAQQIVDPRVKALAGKGLLKSFSIGGAGKRTPQEP